MYIYIYFIFLFIIIFFFIFFLIICYYYYYYFFFSILLCLGYISYIVCVSYQLNVRSTGNNKITTVCLIFSAPFYNVFSVRDNVLLIKYVLKRASN